MSDIAQELSAALAQLRAAEEELRERNEALVVAWSEVEAERLHEKELFANAPVAYVVTDAEGTIQRANQAAAGLLGTAPERLEGMPLIGFVTPAERNAIQALLRELGHDSSVHELEVRVTHQVRGEIFARARVRAMTRAGRRRELRWSLEDVTAQRRVEIELRVLAVVLEKRVEERTRELEKERARLSAILESLPVGLVLIDAETRRAEVANAAASEILGGAVELSDREGYRAGGPRYTDDDWPVVRSLETGERVVGERAEIVRGDGSRVHVELSSAPIRDPNAGIVGAVSIVHDVTDREQREVAEREFVTNAAHELRTPLAAIIGAIEVLQAGAKDDPEARERFLGHVEREAQRLRRLVQALLTLARAQTGAEDAKLEIVPFCTLLEEVVATLKPPPAVPVEIDCPADLGTIGNRDLLERVVANLVANAAQHTSKGRIEVRAVGSDGVVELSFTDTGPGLPADERDRIFDRFYRGSHDREGFGLGLAIVSQAVRAMDGTIEVDSPEGGGTVVRVRLRAATVLTP